MRPLTLICMIFLFCNVSAKERAKRANFICGQPPYQYYSNAPCNQIGAGVQPGSRCQNGGTFLGWTCQQAVQCHFSTASGILYGQCVNNNCCTRRNRKNPTSTIFRKCPSNMVRNNRFCTINSQCILTSTILNKFKQIVGTCRGGRCCVPKLKAVKVRQNRCHFNEHQTNVQCSIFQPCQNRNYYATVVCRGGYCCESDQFQPGPTNRQICGAQTGGNLIANSQCNYDTHCKHYISVANQNAVCDRNQRRCCLKQCPQGSTPHNGICQVGVASCTYIRNNLYERGVCYNGVCCGRLQQILNGK